jgi:hypothetical protein
MARIFLLGMLNAPLKPGMVPRHTKPAGLWQREEPGTGGDHGPVAARAPAARGAGLGLAFTDTSSETTLMRTFIAIGSSLVAALLLSTGALAADPAPAGRDPASQGGGKPKTPPAPEAFYEHSGFEGREVVLADAIVKAIREARPMNGETLNFNADQQRMLGSAVAKAIKTISNDTPYQHEMNDALIKAHLTTIQFAKDSGVLDKLISHEAKTQSPMIARVGNLIRGGGSPELGTIALTERTACFYQLVQDYQRTGTTMRWKSPYGNVLAVSVPLGQHDLTEQEIYETYTMPLMQKQAEIMGMTIDMSPWQADGWVSMTLQVPTLKEQLQ